MSGWKVYEHSTQAAKLASNSVMCAEINFVICHSVFFYLSLTMMRLMRDLGISEEALRQVINNLASVAQWSSQ